MTDKAEEGTTEDGGEEEEEELEGAEASS